MYWIQDSTSHPYTDDQGV